MNHLQACNLFQQIHKGAELGANADGDIIYGDTPFSIAKTALGYDGVHLYRKSQGTKEHPYDTAKAVAFLREWADALEVPT